MKKKADESNKLQRRAARAPMRLAPEERVAEIEVAAREVLAEKGYQGFLPSDVARRCGVSEATIYRYFPTKRDLLVKVAEDWFAELLAIEPEMNSCIDIFNQLRLIIRHSLWVIRTEPALSRFFLQELRPDPAYRSMRIFELNRKFTRHVVTLVQEGVAAGNFRSDISPQLVRDLIYGCIEHQTWSYLRGEGDFDLDKAADDIAGIILHGVSLQPLAGSAALDPVVAGLQSNVDSLQKEIDRLRAWVKG